MDTDTDTTIDTDGVLDTDIIVSAVTPPTTVEVPVHAGDHGSIHLSPDSLDLMTAFAAFLGAEVLKLAAAKSGSAQALGITKRFMPVFILFIGAAARTALEFSFATGDAKTAIVKGLMSGAGAVYFHAVGKSATGKSALFSQVLLAAAAKPESVVSSVAKTAPGNPEQTEVPKKD